MSLISVGGGVTVVNVIVVKKEVNLWMRSLGVGGAGGDSPLNFIQPNFYEST